MNKFCFKHSSFKTRDMKITSKPLAMKWTSRQRNLDWKNANLQIPTASNKKQITQVQAIYSASWTTQWNTIYWQFYVGYQPFIEFNYIIDHQRVLITHLIELIHYIGGMKSRLSVLFRLYIQKCFWILNFKEILLKLLCWSGLNKVLFLLFVFLNNFFITLWALLLDLTH